MEEKAAFAQKLMVPDIDSDSRYHQNIEHFLHHLLPLLEHIRTETPATYQKAIEGFRSRWEGKVRAGNLKDTLEYLLVFLKQSFGMEFYLEETPDEYMLETVSCPLVDAIHRMGMDSELERRTLCFHCSQYHFQKFLNMLGATNRLELHPNGCHFHIEKDHTDEENPLFY